MLDRDLSEVAKIIYEGPEGPIEEQYSDEDVRIHIEAGLFQLSNGTDSKYIPRERVYSWEFETEGSGTENELASYIQ